MNTPIEESIKQAKQQLPEQAKVVADIAEYALSLSRGYPADFSAVIVFKAMVQAVVGPINWS